MDRRNFLQMSIAAPLAAEVLKKNLTDRISVDRTTGILAPKIEEDEAYWNTIRDQFPITRELIYMNNGTLGPSPREVTKRVTTRIEHVDSTGDYGGDYEGLRSAIAKVIGAESGDNVAFTHNVSEAISIIASGIEMKRGDEVILTDQEHAGNAIPWLARAKRDGIVVKFITLAPDDATILERIEAAITPRTKAIAMPHIPCTTGQVLPIKEIAALAHKHGAWMMADGAHPPGMMVVDVKELGVDAYASCGHKWLCGPKGIGFLYITPEFRPNVLPTWSGAEADKHWDYTGTLEFLPTASRYDFATQNFALFDGLHAAVDWMSAIGFEKIQARVRYLTTYLRKQLSARVGDHFRYLTPANSVTGLTTIKLLDMEYREFANTLLSRHKVRTRVVPESNLEANRFSVHIYTSPNDIDLFVDGAAEVLKNRPSKG